MTKHQTISAERACALAFAKAPWLREYVDFRQRDYENSAGDIIVHLYSGDTVFDGDFAVEANSVLVDGNLDVRGVLSDCADRQFTLLVVLGDLTARDMLSCGSVAVDGSVHVERLIYVNSLFDCSFVVYGDLSADGFVEEGSHSWVGGNIDTRQIVQCALHQGRGDAKQEYEDGSEVEASEVLLPEFLDGDNTEIRAIFMAQREGRVVLK
ncbi:hypothetical protein G6O69_13015 [Pseudenhygromyxa sp. WMMC2535]|uniref:hypothetical protein n=1 Tax=Pseudenhygromyxa sp. WMMC2535 TaxID=2712867 RepID=UPI00155690D3|nr:hypothetical protein [Pseudenhygromyxa sp. WMMC2535]NVB38754.1 hypothetical protein [Pseudenhygromyxa sp. WMMC2535]